MKKKQPIRTTLRFRKWSRKAYAAFASIGRCVTIGCLPKGVADSSLSKQKAGAAAGSKSGGQCLEDTNDGKCRETDIGMPPNCENRPGTMFGMFGFGALQTVLCPINDGLQRTKCIYTIINKNRTRMTRAKQRLYISFV